MVGSGAAGLAAALSARENGAESVLVAEAEGVVGGSSRLSGGLTMGAGTRYQRALGITDDADSLFHDYMTLNHWDVEAGVARRLADLAGPAVEWLGDLGVEFYDQLVYGGDERVPRVHCPIGRGQAVVDVLHRACRQAGVEVALGQRVDRLLVEDGAVAGVAVGADTITAGAVVLATGGFGNDPARLAAHFPSAAATEWTWYIGAPGSRGDALDLADQVGAQTLGHDRGLRLLHAELRADLRGVPARLDRDRQPRGPALLRRDRALRHHRRAAAGPGRRRLRGLRRRRTDRPPPPPGWPATSSWSPARRRSRARTGTPTSSSRWWPPERCARPTASPGWPRRSGCRSSRSRAASRGTTRRSPRARTGDYLKDPKFLEPIAIPPFYGAEIRPATVCFTACGPRIDRDAQVLDTTGRPVPGLFAAGECTGGVIGPAYVGSGNSYANCVVFGRVAGAGAAAGESPLRKGSSG